MTEQTEYIEIDLLRMLRALWRRAWAILLAAVLGAVAFSSFAAAALEPRYQSNVRLYVGEGGQGLVNTAIVLLESKVTLNAVIEEAGLEDDTEELLKKIEAFGLDSSGIFEIVVHSSDPLEAEVIANAIAEILPETVAAFVGGDCLQVVDYAEAAEPNPLPHTLYWLLAGALVGGILACGIIVFADVQDDRIRTASDLNKLSQAPVLSEISDGEEAYQMLRVKLLALLPQADCPVLGISSGEAAEGKSQTALHLARAFAESGKRVLLMEGDFRHATLAKALLRKENPGVAQRLESGVADVIQPCKGQDSLWFIPAGEGKAKPSELFSSEEMKTWMAQLRGEFDFIIVDLPPVNVYSDALSLSPLLDGFLLVAGREQSTAQAMKKALGQLELVGAKVWGFVLSEKS